MATSRRITRRASSIRRIWLRSDWRQNMVTTSPAAPRIAASRRSFSSDSGPYFCGRFRTKLSNYVLAMSAVLVKRSTKPVKHPRAAVNMDQTALLAHLQALTGDLDPGDAGPADLHDLRRRLAASLRDLPGETPPDVATLPEESCLASQLKLAVAESPAERVPEGSRLFVVRRQAALDLQGLVSSASNPLAGQAPAKVFGPFSDELRNPVWFDEFLIGPTNQIVWTGHAEITL